MTEGGIVVGLNHAIKQRVLRCLVGAVVSFPAYSSVALLA
jgi:hypothetical protein